MLAGLVVCVAGELASRAALAALALVARPARPAAASTRIPRRRRFSPKAAASRAFRAAANSLAAAAVGDTALTAANAAAKAAAYGTTAAVVGSVVGLVACGCGAVLVGATIRHGPMTVARHLRRALLVARMLHQGCMPRARAPAGPVTVTVLDEPLFQRRLEGPVAHPVGVLSSSDDDMDDEPKHVFVPAGAPTVLPVDGEEYDLVIEVGEPTKEPTGKPAGMWPPPLTAAQLKALGPGFDAAYYARSGIVKVKLGEKRWWCTAPHNKPPNLMAEMLAAGRAGAFEAYV